MGGSSGGGGSCPLKNHKNIGFLSNASKDHLEISKATYKQAFNVGSSSARQRNVNYTLYFSGTSHQLNKSCLQKVGKVSTNFAAAKNGKVGSNFSAAKNGQVSSNSKKR